MRPTYAVINLSNLKYNYLNIRKKIKNVKVMAVVKADAYGHGVRQVVNALDSMGKKRPDYYAVAINEEAVELRQFKIKQPILIFDPVDYEQAEDIFKYNLIPTVFNYNHLSVLKKGIKEFGRKYKISGKIPVHIKIDTGMNRLGIDFDKAEDFILKISRSEEFFIDGIYTHYATSDEKDKKFALLQTKRFSDLLLKIKQAGINYGLAHAANSGAILDLPGSYFDMVRPGISLYGYYPSKETSESIPLKPVMSVISHVTSVKEIKAGETVGYGRLFKAGKKTKIINVPIGYADGFNRNLTNRSRAIIKDKYFNQIGRVAMDRIMFNIKGEDIKYKDEVILLGEKKDKRITAWDWCKVLNTIPYEITCNISKRVPRIYKK